MLQIAISLRKHEKAPLQSLRDAIIWLMLDFPLVMFYWCLIVECDITCENGAMPTNGHEFILRFGIITDLDIIRPQNYQELFNLRHAQARLNVSLVSPSVNFRSWAKHVNMIY